MKDWHYYRDPLRVSERDRFDVCFDNWIKKDYWTKIIQNIEVDLINFSKDALEF